MTSRKCPLKIVHRSVNQRHGEVTIGHKTVLYYELSSPEVSSDEEVAAWRCCDAKRSPANGAGSGARGGSTASVDNPRTNPTHIAIRTKQNGKPAVSEAVCTAVRASSPAAAPAISNTAATTPSNMAQNRRCCQRGFGSPPLVRISTTSDPESDEVAKNRTTTITATMAERVTIILPTGSCSNNTNSAVSSEASAKALLGSSKRVRSADSPKIPSHTIDAPTGANKAPVMNCRIVRP